MSANSGLPGAPSAPMRSIVAKSRSVSANGNGSDIGLPSTDVNGDQALQPEIDAETAATLIVSHCYAIRWTMSELNARQFDLNTISLLREVLESVWATLEPAKRELITRSEIAEAILKAAAAGERDREHLIAVARRVAPLQVEKQRPRP